MNGQIIHEIRRNVVPVEILPVVFGKIEPRREANVVFARPVAKRQTLIGVHYNESTDPSDLLNATESEKIRFYC